MYASDLDGGIKYNVALEIFSHHNDYESTHEDKRGIYLREYTVLQSLPIYWMHVNSSSFNSGNINQLI